MTLKPHKFAFLCRKQPRSCVFSLKSVIFVGKMAIARIINGTKRNTSKMIKETISPVQNAGTQMSQEENHG